MSIRMPVEAERDFEPMEAGIHAAVCVMVADLGPQETNWGPKHKVYLRFEVPSQRYENKDGEDFAMSIGAKFTASLNAKSNLRKALVSWSGKDKTDEEWEEFDLESVLGKPAMLVVSQQTSKQTGKPYARIDNIVAYTGDGIAPERTPVVYGLGSSAQELEDAPQWIAEAVVEYQNAEAEDRDALNQQQNDEAASRAADDDDIPF